MLGNDLMSVYARPCCLRVFIIKNSALFRGIMCYFICLQPIDMLRDSSIIVVHGLRHKVIRCKDS
jgi:hypothetical protein